MRQVVDTIVGIAQIVVHIGTDALLQQLLVLLDGLLVLSFSVRLVGFGLRHSLCAKGHQQHEQGQRSTGLRLLHLVLLHTVLDILYGRHGLLVDLVHVTLRIAGGIAFELTLVDSLDERHRRRLVHLTFQQLLRDILARQLLDGHIQLVAHIAPQGTQRLVVELIGTVVLHQAGGFLQSAGSHLIGHLATRLHQVGILDGSLTEDDKQRHEDQHEHCQVYQVVG